MSTAREGAAALTTRVKGIPAAPDVSTRLSPTGGAIIPIIMLTTVMMPR